MGFMEIFKREEKPPKHWTQEKWARQRRLYIRGDVPGKNYDPEATVILDTDERRLLVGDAIRTVIADALSEEGPQWARGLSAEELKKPLDLQTLLDDFESGRLYPEQDASKQHSDD